MTRERRAQLDKAVWIRPRPHERRALFRGHGYTVSPAARKELLRRLLALNYARAAAEKATAKPAKPKRSPNAALPHNDHIEMFPEDPGIS